MPSPRIDQSAHDSFREIEGIMAVQAEIYRLMTTFYLNESKRAQAIEAQLGTLKISLNNEPELFEMMNAAIGKSTKFQTMLTHMPTQDLKNSVAFGLIKDPETHNYMIQVGKHDATHPLVTLGDKEDGYATSNYITNTKSNWLTQSLPKPLGEAQDRTAIQIEAFLREERVCVSKTAISRVLLTQYLNSAKVSGPEKQTIHSYLTLLQKQQDAYTKLELHKILDPSDQTLEQVKSRLNEKFKSNDYIKYHQTMEDLIPLTRKINELSGQYPTLPSKDDIEKATRVIMDRPKQTRVTAALISNELNYTATNRLASFNAAARIDEGLAGKTPVQRKESALQTILSFNPSAIYITSDDSAIVHFRNTSLVHLLSEAFPDMFTRDQGVLAVTPAYYTTSKASLPDIYDALGMSVNQKFTILDPKNFKKLNEGFAKDPNNPLWPMLKIIKPVDNPTYKITDKINAYVETIKLIHSGDLTLNNTRPLEQTHLLANNLLELINQPVDEHFTIVDKTAAQLAIIHLIKDGEFKINDRSPLEQAREIAASTVDAVYDATTPKHELSSELRSKLSNINDAIESSIFVKGIKRVGKGFTEKEDRNNLPEEDKTPQRRLRELIHGTGKPKETQSRESMGGNVNETASLLSVDPLKRPDQIAGGDVADKGNSNLPAGRLPTPALTSAFCAMKDRVTSDRVKSERRDQGEGEDGVFRP